VSNFDALLATVLTVLAALAAGVARGHVTIVLRRKPAPRKRQEAGQ
jgi:hypothetical protein